MRWLTALLCLSLLGTAQAQPSLESSTEVQEQGLLELPLPIPATDLHIYNPQGALEVRGWNRKGLVIRFRKRAPTLTLLELLKVQVDVQDNRVRIRTGVEARGELRALPQPNAAIDLVIDAPEGAQLWARTFASPLVVGGFRKGADVGSQSGPVQVSEVSGPVRSQTGQGDQRLLHIDGQVEASGVSGALELRAISAPRVVAQLVTGPITAEDLRTQEARLESLWGNLLLLGTLSPLGRYQLQSEGGDIQVLLFPTDLRLSLEAQGPSVRNQLPLPRQPTTGLLRLRSTRGNITLRPADPPRPPAALPVAGR